MKKGYQLLACLLCAVMMLSAGCAGRMTGETTTTEAVVKPQDNPVLDGRVTWCRGDREFDDIIGYGGEWSLQVSDEGHWEQLQSEYNLVMESEEPLDFSRYVILVLFYGERTGSEYELTELAMVDGMATIGIHEKTPGETDGEELVGCIVELDEMPLEINSYRDEEAVG